MFSIYNSPSSFNWAKKNKQWSHKYVLQANNNILFDKGDLLGGNTFSHKKTEFSLAHRLGLRAVYV